MKVDKIPETQLAAPVSARPVDPMEQVRDLLFGESKRSHENQLAELNAMVNALEQRISYRLDELQTQLNTLRDTGRAEQDAAVNAIGDAIANVGRTIAALKTHGG